MSRTVFITGGTGLIGRRLIARLLARGDRLRVISRSGPAQRMPGMDRVTWVTGDITVPGAWQQQVDGCDAVIHFAGAPIAERRWTPRVWSEIVESRLDGTHQMVEAMRMATRRPAVFVSGSAIGWYGATSGAVDETSAPGPADRLTELCAAWEAQAMEAQAEGIRTVCLRTGLVLDSEGGVLARMVPPFRFFVGGPLGSGRQVMSWIHWRDVIGLTEFALHAHEIRGPMNAVAPGTVTNRDFSRALGRVLHRPSLFPVPRFVLRVVAGPIAPYILCSQDVRSDVAMRAGYRFMFPEIEPALRDLLRPAGNADEPASGSSPERRVAADAASGFTPRAGGANASDGIDAGEGAMPPCPVRLVVIGVEGALLRADGRLAEGVAMACRAASDAGCMIVLASGKPPRSLVPLASAMGLRTPLIAYNGALLWDPVADGADSCALHHEPLSHDIAASVIAAARAAAPSVRIGIERLDKWFTDRTDEGNGALRADGVGPLDSFLDAPVSQLCVLGAPSELALVRSAIETEFWKSRRIARFVPASNLLLITHPSVDRGIALQRAARRLGVGREAIMVIAGSVDDMGMLDCAGFPVAVATAPDRVRELARAVVPGADDHGVARALHRFVIAPGRIEPAAEGDR